MECSRIKLLASIYDLKLYNSAPGPESPKVVLGMDVRIQYLVVKLEIISRCACYHGVEQTRRNTTVPFAHLHSWLSLQLNANSIFDIRRRTSNTPKQLASQEPLLALALPYFHIAR